MSNEMFFVKSQVRRTNHNAQGKRHQFFAKHEFTCYACKRKASSEKAMASNGTLQYLLNNDPSWFLTLDHMQPRSQGGPGRFSNFLVMCNKCNQRKANKPLEYLLYVINNNIPPIYSATSLYNDGWFS